MVATIARPEIRTLRPIEEIPLISSDRYNRIVFEDFGEATGFDAAYIIADDGAIVEAIAEPAARTTIAGDWDEAAFVAAIDTWAQAEFSFDELNHLQLQLLPEGPATHPCQTLKFIH